MTPLDGVERIKSSPDLAVLVWQIFLEARVYDHQNFVCSECTGRHNLVQFYNPSAIESIIFKFGKRELTDMPE